MNIQLEPFDSVLPDWLPLVQLQYEELTHHKDVVKLNPKWDDYRALEGMGRFVVFTARESDGTLVGYNAFFVNQHIHYADLTVAVNDLFYVRDEYRHGPTAFRLIRFAEAALKRLGVRKVAYHFKHGNKLGAILNRMRYENEEGVVGKII